MNCMKCGREVDDGQVFCPECLEVMEQDPIRISASVQIPRQPPRRNTPRRPAIHLEEELRRVERANEILRIWIILLAVASMLLGMAIYHGEIQHAEDMGKNYSVVETRGHPR